MGAARTGARLLAWAGAASLAFAVAVLTSLGGTGLVVVAFLGALVLPAVASAIAAVVTGMGVMRRPERSYVPAVVAAGSLAVCAGLFTAFWSGLEPADGVLFASSGTALLVGAVVLAAVAAGALGAAVLLVAAGRGRTVPQWQTGAAYVRSGLVAVLVGALTALAQPRAGDGSGGGVGVQIKLADPQADAVCDEARALPTPTLEGVDAGDVRVPPFPGTTPVGATVLPATTGVVAVQGLQRYASSESPTAVAVLETTEDDGATLLRQVREGLALGGLVETGVSSVRIGGDLDVESVSYSAPGREGRIDVVDCGSARLLALVEPVPVERTGACGAAELRERCASFLAAVAPVLDEYGPLVPVVEDGRLLVRLTGSALTPSGFLVGDVVDDFTAAGWRVTSSSCSDPCLLPSEPVQLAFAKPGLAAEVAIRDGEPDTVIEAVVREVG